MGPQAKKEYLALMRGRYRKAVGFERSGLLDEFVRVYGCHRKHAIRLMRCAAGVGSRRPGRPVVYERALLLAPLKRLWLAAEQPCSKRLRAMIGLWLPYYERHYGRLDAPVRKALTSLSASTIDRLLGDVRARRRKGLCGTRAGRLLRSQIPIRTGTWDVKQPGWLEADTVAHCGTSLAGNFVWSLTFTDIWSGWTENRAVWNKGAHGVVEHLRDLEVRLAFPMRGFDCDNGAEFLNHHLARYLAERPRPVEFTRSRPYHSNDNAHVEQRHWTHVRQLFGYDRLDSPRLVEPMNNLYANEWGLFHNFFCPSVKLLDKRRDGSRMKRRYDPPRTPYERLLESPDIADSAKHRLKETFASLDPFELKKAIERKTRIIFTLARELKSPGQQPPPRSQAR